MLNMSLAKETARKLGLMYFNENAAGQMFITGRGMRMFNSISQILRKFLIANNYQEVSTPAIGSAMLWGETGHIAKYSEDMYSLRNGKEYLKPMNCPFHLILMQNMYNDNIVDLPIKFYEFNRCYRNEAEGAINPMFRLKTFTQDDSHIIANYQDAGKIIFNFLQHLIRFYNLADLKPIFRLSSVDLKRYIGEAENLKKSLDLLKKSINSLNIDYIEAEDEGAFYGPKIDIVVEKNEKKWQLGTIQADLCSIANLKLKFHTNDIIVLHHATAGTIERFMSALLDIHGIHLPFFFTPYQICIIPFSQSEVVDAYIKNIIARMKKTVSEIDIIKEDHYNTSIKKAEQLGYYYIFCIGEKEMNSNSINVRERGKRYNITIQEMEKNLNTKYEQAF